MHELLIFLGDASLLLVGGVLVLLFLSLLGAMSPSKDSFLATWPVILLGPVLPVLSRLGINVLDWRSPFTQAGNEGSAANFRTVRQAMDYLVNRIVDEAKLQGLPLTEIERKMLYFSETHPTLRDMQAVSAEFDRSCDEGAYEEKIAVLVRRIAARDQRQDLAAKAAWDEAVAKLSEGDYYLLALIDPKLSTDGKVRPPHDILKLWITAFGIVFGCIALMAIGNWLLQQDFFLQWLHRL